MVSVALLLIPLSPAPDTSTSTPLPTSPFPLSWIAHKPVPPPPQTSHVGVSVLDSPAFNVIFDGIDPDCNSMSDDGGASPLALADMVNVAVTL